MEGRGGGKGSTDGGKERGEGEGGRGGSQDQVCASVICWFHPPGLQESYVWDYQTFSPQGNTSSTGTTISMGDCFHFPIMQGDRPEGAYSHQRKAIRPWPASQLEQPSL